MRIFSFGRDNVGLNQWNLDGNGWGTSGLWFGGSYGTSWGPSGVASVYAFWHPQTWHLYDNMHWERHDLAPSSRHVKKDFIYGGGDYRSGWRSDIEFQLTVDIDSSTYDFVATLPKEWTRRHLLKLTVLEVTRDILASEIESEWAKNVHHEDHSPEYAPQSYSGSEVIHKKGDLFVRAELIQLKRGTDDGIGNGNVDFRTSPNTLDAGTYTAYANTMPTASTTAVENKRNAARALEDRWIYDSRNWVYSKPLWFGKFRGDAWQGREDYGKRKTGSPFKRMGMSMMHLVADPEPKGGDVQSFRGILPGESPDNVKAHGAVNSDGSPVGPGRGVRVRSWKDHFRGWPFSDDPDVNASEDIRATYAETAYEMDLEKGREGQYSNSPRDVLHPDLTFIGDEELDSGRTKRTAGESDVIDKLKDLKAEHRMDGVWTPPIAIDLEGWGHHRWQSLDPAQNRSANPGYSKLNGTPIYGDEEDSDFASATWMYYGQDSYIKSKKGFQGDIHRVYQWGPTQSSAERYATFGQYAYYGQFADYERRMVSPAVRSNTEANRQPALYEFGYNGIYTAMLYGRMSLLRPDSRVSTDYTVPEVLTREPVWGLYAIRAWDYQRGVMGWNSRLDEYVYDFQHFMRHEEMTLAGETAGEARKRLLMVVQGLQLTHQPSRQTVVTVMPSLGKAGNPATGNFKRQLEMRTVTPDESKWFRRIPEGSSQHDGNPVKNYSTYKKDRVRTFGLHFWGNNRSKGSGGNNVAKERNPNRFEINEVWFGEGFSPVEVREILGLDPGQFPLPEAKLSLTGLSDLSAPEVEQIKRIMELYTTKVNN
jgi:hypothetical protein